MSKKYNAVANANQSVSKSFVKGAAILTVSMVIVKVFGLLDKVILADIYSMFGDSFASMGMGIYSNAYEVFGVIFIVATGGLPIVISRMISESMAEEHYKDVRQIHRLSVPLFTVVGTVCMIGLMIISFPYSEIIKSPYAIYAMLALAPTVLFGCLASIYRGYYEGQRNMFPTAVSEVIEAVVKLIAGAAFAYLIMRFGMEHYRDTGNFLWFTFDDHIDAENTILAFSVAGNICGITLASFCSFLFLMLKYKIGGDGIPEEYLRNSVEARRQRETLGIIVKTALPIVGGALVMSVGSMIDAMIIQNVLFNLAKTDANALYRQYAEFYPPVAFFGDRAHRLEPTIHTSLWGCYGSSLTLMQLVTAVTQVFGSSAMPNVTSAWTKGDKGELKTSVDTVLKMTMMFTLPMAFGLSVMSHQVMGFIYSSPDIFNIGGDVLRLMGITTIFTAIITPICSMLNGIGKVRLPLILYSLCMVIKIGTSWMFVSIPSINIQGGMYGDQDRHLMDVRQHPEHQYPGRDSRLSDLLRDYMRGRHVPADPLFRRHARLPFDDRQTPDRRSLQLRDGVRRESPAGRSHEPPPQHRDRDRSCRGCLYCSFTNIAHIFRKRDRFFTKRGKNRKNTCKIAPD